MATLILGAVGGIFGGAVGRLAGAVIGQQIDGRLLGPKPANGPRLSDLSIQSSSYGAPLPRLYGRTRVSGTVIWATDLQEERRRVSTGKGRPKQTVFSYTANFAVALSARPAGRIGRIWADGKLLRGAAEDFKTQTGFRFHNGGEDQEPDPLIAASEGVGLTPAYRGIAYGVFEDFELEAYGNRIPSISFEVIADEGEVPVAAILADVLPDDFSASGTSQLPGIAIAGETASAVIADLSAVFDLGLDDAPAGPAIREGGMAGAAISADDMGAVPGNKGGNRIERERMGLGGLPGRYRLGYFDNARDYLEGQQDVARPQGGLREERIDFPASLSAPRAKALLTSRLARALARRERATIALPWRALSLTPGQSVQVPGLGGRWRVEGTVLEGMVLRASLSREASLAALAQAADAGRVLSEPDFLPGSTLLHLLDLPWFGAGFAISPSIYAAAAGSSAAWRAAALMQSGGAGSVVEEIGSTAAPAILGTVVAPPGAGFGFGFDDGSTLEVELAHASMMLSGADDQLLLGGRNLALVGDEVLQFGRAVRLSNNRYRLSRLLRGRRGSEWAMSGHVIGERFTLIEQDALVPITAPANAMVTIYAAGRADPEPVEASLAVTGRAVEPLSPAHLSSHAEVGGAIRLSWIRRSRDGWRWDDFVDAPLGEQTELYRITVLNGAAVLRVAETSLPEWLYDPVSIAADIAAGAASVSIEVRQIGTYAVSRPATISVQLS